MTLVQLTITNVCFRGFYCHDIIMAIHGCYISLTFNLILDFGILFLLFIRLSATYQSAMLTQYRLGSRHVFKKIYELSCMLHAYTNFKKIYELFVFCLALANFKMLHEVFCKRMYRRKTILTVCNSSQSLAHGHKTKVCKLEILTLQDCYIIVWPVVHNYKCVDIFDLYASICAIVSNKGKVFVSGVNVSNTAAAIAVDENRIDGSESRCVTCKT